MEAIAKNINQLAQVMLMLPTALKLKKDFVFGVLQELPPVRNQQLSLIVIL